MCPLMSDDVLANSFWMVLMHSSTGYEVCVRLVGLSNADIM